MATRRHGLPRLPELPDHPGRALLNSLHQLVMWRPANGRLFIWRLLWLPFWLGGDIPVPWLPDHERRVKAGSPAALSTSRAIDSIGRRIWVNWIIACIARGLWLPFAIGSVVGLVDLARGTHFAPERLIWVWVVTLPLGLALGIFLRPKRRRVAWMMDHTFNLHDRMTTAVEALETDAPPAGMRAPMAYLQLADTANAAIGLRGDPRLRLRLPARELSLAIMAGLMLCALLFLRGVGGHIPGADETAVPIFVPAADRQKAAQTQTDNANPAERPPNVDEVVAKSDRSNAARQDLNAIADALDENAITLAAADSIRKGDYATAAQQIRDAASRADELSPDSQAALANALDQAAASSKDSSPALSNAASEAANGLREGGKQAESSMRDLGDAVDLAGESVVPQPQLDSEMQQAQQNAANQPKGADAGQNQSSNSSNSSQNRSNQPTSNQSTSNSQSAPSDTASSSDTQGADASGSTSDQGQDPATDPSASQSADSSKSDSANAQSGEANSADQSSNAGKPGDSSQNSGEASGGQPSSNQDGSQSSSQSQSSQDSSSSSSTGSGDPSGGNSSKTPPKDDKGSGGGQASENKSQESAPPVATNLSQATAPTGAGIAPTVVPTAAVQLPGESNKDAVQLNGNSGSASTGGGSGATMADGNATQEALPTAGPESNRVPPEYRSVVENYFNRGAP